MRLFRSILAYLKFVSYVFILLSLYVILRDIYLSVNPEYSSLIDVIKYPIVFYVSYCGVEKLIKDFKKIDESN